MTGKAVYYASQFLQKVAILGKQLRKNMEDWVEHDLEEHELDMSHLSLSLQVYHSNVTAGLLFD